MPLGTDPLRTWRSAALALGHLPPSSMLPEQSSTMAIEPVPSPKRRMISSLARMATLASGGSGGAGPIAMASGTTWRSTSVGREKTWPRKKPSIFRAARPAGGVGQQLREAVGPALGGDDVGHDQAEHGGRASRGSPRDNRPSRVCQLQRSLDRRLDDRDAGRPADHPRPFGIDDAVLGGCLELAGYDQAFGAILDVQAARALALRRGASDRRRGIRGRVPGRR